MKLQMVVYSDVPGQRFVYIDNQKYVEGSSIDGKLVIEKITPDGAILNYEGTRLPLRQ
jgi:general secretion pathway protein B